MPSSRGSAAQAAHLWLGSFALLAPFLLVGLEAAPPRQDVADLGASECVSWHRPGKVLFYKDTAVHAIGISLPSELVAEGVPPKQAEPPVAPFAGSTIGGDTAEYTFGPGDEEAYHGWYAKHRFAITKRKGGWDALRHAEILAAGTVPLFEGLAEAPSYSVPFVPRTVLDAQRLLTDGYSDKMEAAYNATVRGLLAHTRRCLTSEAMAAYVLKTMGLWPTVKPLRLLYVSCGWRVQGGWQGPVSIGLFIGLQRLLDSVPGSSIVDVGSSPDEESLLWYTFEDEQAAAAESEVEARQQMYGYGFSYARRLPRRLATTDQEQRQVHDEIHRRAFDAVIFGKFGPRQGCEPLPYFDKVLEAGYPAQRVALVFGGDFGLKSPEVSRHIRLVGGTGTVFVREIDAEDKHFRMMPTSVLPAACYMETEWRVFFKLWDGRLRCWGCLGTDHAVFNELWPFFYEDHQSLAANHTGKFFGSLGGAADAASQLSGRATPCWSGLVLLAFPVLGLYLQRDVPSTQACSWFAARLLEATQAFARLGAGTAGDDFLEAFGVRFGEVRAFICSACDGRACGRLPGRGLSAVVPPPAPGLAALFNAHVPPQGRGQEQSLAELRRLAGEGAT